MLANERAFVCWMPIGTICIALGLEAVFKGADYPQIAKGDANVFIVVAILILYAAVTKSCETQTLIDDHDVGTHPCLRLQGNSGYCNRRHLSFAMIWHRALCKLLSDQPFF